MVQLILILDNLRSAHNVGSILRTADAVGVERVIAAGITPYPLLPNDSRDPAIAKRNTQAIAKTALGAELTVYVEHIDSTVKVLDGFRREGRTLFALEQAPRAANLLRTPLPLPAVLIVGSETDGIDPGILIVCDKVLEIPQAGAKESLNVAVAAGIALYRFVK